jgi:hypothetical protein
MSTPVKRYSPYSDRDNQGFPTMEYCEDGDYVSSYDYDKAQALIVELGDALNELRKEHERLLADLAKVDRYMSCTELWEHGVVASNEEEAKLQLTPAKILRPYLKDAQKGAKP